MNIIIYKKMIERKKLLMLSVMALTFTASSEAQGVFGENLFNHYAVGLTCGTTGYGLDVATTIGDIFQLRAGFTTIPKIKIKTSLDVSSVGDYSKYADYASGIPESVDVEGKLNMTNFKLLLDIFPFKKSNFHITAGAYIGPDKLVQVYNKQEGILMPVTVYNKTVTSENQLGLMLDDYLLKPNESGNVEANIKVQGFKPYLGFGFGRAVPRKNRVGFMFEMGCQFWGTPKVYNNGDHLTSDDFGDDAGGAIKIFSKIIAYPVISFRLCGRIL